MAHKEILLQWLNNAHSMETSLVETLSRHADEAEDYPEIQSKILEHVEVTRDQVERVKQCIESLGGDVSKIKQTVGKMTGYIQGIMNRPGDDTLVKNAIAEYSAEHLKIATYTVIIEAAHALDKQEVANVCEDILEQEEAMAQWLEETLPVIANQYIQEMRSGESHLGHVV